MNIKQLTQALKEAARWAEWEQESLEDFHQYAQRFGGKAGSNVYTFVLSHALAHQGLTVEQFRQEYKRK